MPRTDQLRMFLVVAECKDFSSAARELGKMPSFISRSIALLENELGFGLFTRSTRQVALTEAGMRYYGVCRTLLANLDETARLLRSGSHVRQLRIGLSASLQGIFMPALSEFCQEFPECRFVIGLPAVDTALQVLDFIPEGDWPLLSLGNIDWVYVAAPRYLEHSARLVGFSDLNQQRLLLAEHQQQGIYMRQADALLRWQPENAHIFTELNTVLDAVKQGMGVAFLPYTLVHQAILAGDVLRVLDPLVIPGSAVFCMSNPVLEQSDIMLPLLREKLLAYFRAQQKSAAAWLGRT